MKLAEVLLQKRTIMLANTLHFRYQPELSHLRLFTQILCNIQMSISVWSKGEKLSFWGKKLCYIAVVYPEKSDGTCRAQDAKCSLLLEAAF